MYSVYCLLNTTLRVMADRLRALIWQGKPLYPLVPEVRQGLYPIHLKVGLDFDDLPKLLGVEADVFGATWIDRQQVIIDQSLDPTVHPERIGRYNFTVGHETGHWQLHRPYLLKNADQQALFELKGGPAVVCRASQAREPIEWQADFFSACLLMPKAMLKECWLAQRNGLGPITLGELRDASDLNFGVKNSDDAIIECFSKPLARAFAVSPIAMRIRLETLGLIVREEYPTFFGL